MKRFALVILLTLVSLAQAETWEYGLFISGLDSEGKPSYGWLADGQTLEQRESLAQVYVDLSGTPLGDVSNAEVRLSLLDYLGEQGWELVAVDNSGPIVIYIFKRPKS